MRSNNNVKQIYVAIVSLFLTLVQQSAKIIYD